MNDENKNITDMSLKKKLNKIKSFKKQVVDIKPEELKNDYVPKFITGEKAREKMDSMYLSNSMANSAKKQKLKLITRNDLFIYFEESKRKKSKKLNPIIEESKNSKSSQKRKASIINNIKTNKTISLKSIQIVAKDEKLNKNSSEININENDSEPKENNKNKQDSKINENNKEEEKEKEKNEAKEREEWDKVNEKEEKEEKEKEDESKEEEKENNFSQQRAKSERTKKENELKPIILRNKNISLKASNDITTIKKAIRQGSEEKKINIEIINSKSLSITKDNHKQKSTSKKEYKLQYCVYPGNNSALIDKVMSHRLDEWEKVPTTFSEFCDLVWAPLSGSINFQNCEKRHQYANHIEFNIEISNKMRLYANLLRHCEEKKIDAFSIFPFTISLQLTHWSFSEQLSNFKKLYSNIDSFTPYGKKRFSEMFNVILSRKIGSIQTINIPPSFNSGKNLWIIKPINLNRGRYITVEKNLKDIIEKLETIQEKKKININDKKKGNEIKCEYILIQKYLEKPLLYQGRKFDIRLWVLFIAEQDDDVYIFRQGHLKATCIKYDPDSKDPYVHLTNYSVQKYNENFSKIEIGNEIPFKDFQNELDKNDTGIDFYKTIYPKIVRIVRITGGAAKGKMNFLNKKYCFEIFGYDFILDENYQPYLLEINTNPGLEISSPIINELLPRMIDDALKLTIDKEFTRSMKYADEESIFHVNDYDDKKNMWEKYSII